MASVISPIDIREFGQPLVRLRVALVTDTYSPDEQSVANSFDQLMSGLLERNHCVQLIRPAGVAIAADGEHPFAMGTRLSLALPKHLSLGIPARQHLVRYWGAHRPNVVHIATEGKLGWSALSAARKLHIPIATDLRTHFLNTPAHQVLHWLSKPIASYLRKFHNRANTTLVTDTKIAAELRALGFTHIRPINDQETDRDASSVTPERHATLCYERALLDTANLSQPFNAWQT